VILPPQTMTVPEGQTSGTVNIPTAQVYSTATRQVSASRGGITKVANLTLEPGFVVLSVTVNPSTVDGGKSTTGAVRLSQNAPAGGSQVEVWSNSSVVVVPSTVTVTAGNSSALFTVATKNVGATSVRQVYARFGGVTRQCNLTINPAVLLSTLTVNPSTVKGGTNTTGTVTLTNPAPAGGTVVNLTSNSTALTVPATVTVPQGASTATFTITTARVGSTFTRTITASREGINRSANVTLTP
ncbi:MAG TPA: hypothetical protein VEX38_04665, partial [Fimbriimonadaceae bacterium]|nr:hypothetical protein [Fimbriimonadaceae bacterium]